RSRIGKGTGVPDDLCRTLPHLRFRFPSSQAHHKAGQGREDNFDRRFPGRALRQELRGCLGGHDHRHGGRHSLYRAAITPIAGSIGLMVSFYSPDALSDEFVYLHVAFVVALLLAVFAVLFGTRHTDATEHQDGLVLAMAVESVVKLTAFLAVGVAITLFMLQRPTGLMEKMLANEQVQASLAYETSPTTWIVLTMLAAFAIIMLPRQFYVTIVENRSEKELRTARWVFPLYLVLINLF